MPPGPSFCPYVGLRPFSEIDSKFFFGREREERVIAANIHTEAVTILYGASGVGKSSLLQAGVIPKLKSGGKRTTAVYFSGWHDIQKTQALLSQIDMLANAKKEEKAPACFFLLDQFEEYLLYHRRTKLGDNIDAALARLVNRSEVQSNLLIGIREDSLSELDQRLGLRIPGILNNTLQVQHLDRPSARRAIENPLQILSKETGETYSIQSELVDEILTAALTASHASPAVPAHLYGKCRRPSGFRIPQADRRGQCDRISAARRNAEVSFYF